MTYRVKFSKQAVKFLFKLDPANNALIRSWVRKNLEGTENPRAYGKALQGPLSPYWRYRVTDYRLLAEIQDEKLIIVFIAKVGKRDSIYNN